MDWSQRARICPLARPLQPRDRPALSRGLRVQDVGFPKIKVLRTKGGRRDVGKA